MRYINSSLWILKLMSHFFPSGWVFSLVLELASGRTWNKENCPWSRIVTMLLLSCSVACICLLDPPRHCENSRVLTDNMTQTFMACDGSCIGDTGAEVSSWLIWDVVVLSCVLSSKKLLDSNSVQDALAYVCIFVIHRDTWETFPSWMTSTACQSLWGSLG